MNNLVFTASAWSEYVFWQAQDKKTLRKINELLRDVMRNPFTGIGKPEALKHEDGQFSRRIDEKNRLVYRVDTDNNIVVISCKDHYKI